MTKLTSMMRYFAMLSFLAGALFFSSCNGDEETAPPVAIAFQTGTSSVSENSSSARTITIAFEDFAPQAGTITVQIANGTGTESGDYTTAPASSGNSLTIDVPNGAQSATFSVTPVDNNEVDGNKEVTFALLSADGGLTLGNTVTTHVLTISDDEEPQTVNFATTNDASVMENSTEGVGVFLALSGAVGQASTVTIDVSNNANVTEADYTTDPAVDGGSITLNLAEGDDVASFMVKPVDNSDLNEAERVITFTISAADGGLELAGNNLEFALTITDDEVAITSIADIRAAFDPDNDQLYEEKVVIRGIVTSSNDNLTGRNFFVQDATAGIAIRSAGEDNIYLQGDEVEINLEGGTLSAFRGLVQINELPLVNVAKISEGNDLPDYQVITVEQLSSDEYQGLLVEVQDARFVNADGIATLGGNSDITDATEAVSITRVEGYAPFSDDPQPLGSGTLRGIASIFNSPQLVPTKAEDIFESTPTAEITAAGGPLSFGDVESGAMSAAQSYTVSGTGLTEGILVEAPEAFMVSLEENGTYEPTVTIDGGSGSVSGQTVYVKFAPVSGSSQTITGNIQHTTAGALAASVEVTGEEVANTDVEPTNISDIRSLYDGENNVDITEVTIIKGIVTTGVDNVNSRNIFFEDATAGIVVRFEATPDPRFEPGQELEININGADISDFNDLVQVNGVPLSNVTITGTPGLPSPAVITIEQLNSGDFEGRLVEIQNVSFPDADGTVTFSDNGRNNTIQDADNNQAIVRVNGGSSFQDTVLPSGTGTMRGVVGVYQGTYQLLPTKAEDIFVE